MLINITERETNVAMQGNMGIYTKNHYSHGFLCKCPYCLRETIVFRSVILIRI